MILNELNTQRRMGHLANLMQDSMPSLKRMAHSRLFKSGDLTLLDTTSLVNETFLKMAQNHRLELNDQQQFMAYCARTMRSLIIDYVRARNSEKRGSNPSSITITDAIELPNDYLETTQILRLNDALDELNRFDERVGSVVEMRYFGGFLESEIALTLNVDERTVRRDWQKAKLFLQEALQSG
jgi:RNA polymerase sigma factor (TIGR02999 family)